MVQRGRSIPASSVIDLDWPHQVVLPDDICTDCDFTVITKFWEDRGMRFQIWHFQAVWQNGKYENYPSTSSPTARRLRRFATISLERSSFLNATGRMAKYVASDVAPMSTGASSIAARSVSQRSYAPGAKHVPSLQSITNQEAIRQWTSALQPPGGHLHAVADRFVALHKGDTMKVLDEMIVLNGCLQEQLEALNAPSVGKRCG
jgi:hypothetical protein